MSAGFINNSTMTTPGLDTYHEVEVVITEVNVFFDGTENNFFNVTAPQDIKEKFKGEGSYNNAQSNIAMMWKSLTSDDHLNCVYIDGIGTSRLQPDSGFGKLTGTGETGVAERVHAAFDKIKEKVDKGRDGSQEGPPCLLDINVFGFSRGAAAARYFVHLVNTEGKQRFGKPWNKVHTRINFVGLFDTVASVMDGSLQSNVKRYHLHFGENYAIKVFHLTAADEYRANFPLTSITSACEKACSNDSHTWPMGYELCIPGAHSDVGGGYVEGAMEERNLSSLQRMDLNRQPLPGPTTREFVYQQGWYSAQQQNPDRSMWHGDLHRRKLSNEYHRVGLALMVEMAMKYTHTPYKSSLLTPPKHPLALHIFNALREVIKAEKETHWKLEDWLDAARAKQVRNELLHLSLDDLSVANPPRRNNGGTFEREIIKG